MNLLIFKLVFSFSMFFNTSFVYKTYAENNDKSNITIENAELLTGTGLVAIGGAGSIIIAYNNKNKKMNEPSDEIKSEDRKDI